MSRYPAFQHQEENATPTRIRTYTRPKDVDSSIIKNRVINALGERAPTNVRTQPATYSGIPTRTGTSDVLLQTQQGTCRVPLYSQEEAAAMAGHEERVNGYEQPHHINSATPRRATAAASTASTAHYGAKKTTSELGSMPDKQKERYLVEQTKKYKQEMEEMIRIIDKGMNEQKNLQEKLDSKQRELNKMKDAKKMLSEEKLRVGTENAKLTRKANELETQLTKLTEYSRREASSLQIQVEKFQKRFNESVLNMENLKRKHQAELEDRVNNTSKTNYKLERELSELKKDHSALEAKFRIVVEQSNKVQNLLDEKEQAISELERKLSTADKRLESERKTMQHLESELEKEKELAIKTYETLRTERETLLSESTLSAALKQQTATLEQKVAGAYETLNGERDERKKIIHDNKRLVASLDEEKQRHAQAQKALQQAQDKLAMAAEHEDEHVAQLEVRESDARQAMDQMSHELQESKNRIKELQQQLDDCRQAETASAERIAVLDFNLTEMTTEAKKLADAHRRDVRTQESMQQQINTLTETHAQDMRERDQLKQQNSELSQENERMGSELKGLSRECSRVGEECNRLKRQCDGFAQEVHTYKQDVATYKQERDTYKRERDSYMDECETHKRECVEYKAACEKTRQDRDERVQECDSLKSECADYKDACERYKAEAERRKRQSQGESQTQNETRQQYEKALEARKEEITEQEVSISELRREVKELQRRLFESEQQSEAAHHNIEMEKARLNKCVAQEHATTLKRDKEVERLHLRIADIRKDLGDELCRKANQLRETHDRLEAIQHENEQLKEEVKARSDAMLITEQEKGTMHDSMESTKDRVKKLELTNHSLRKSLEEIECNYLAEQSKYRKAERQLLTLKDELDSQQKTLYDWSNERESRRHGDRDSSEKLKAATAELNRLMGVCRKLEQDLATSEKTCRAHTESAKELRTQLDHRESQSRALQARIQNHKYDNWDVATYEHKLQQMEQQNHNLQCERDAANETTKSLQADLANMQRKLAETSDSLETVRKIYKQQRHEVDSLNARLSSAQNDLSHTADTLARGEAPSLTRLMSGENLRLKQANVDLVHQSLYPVGSDGAL